MTTNKPEPVGYQIREKGSDNWYAISASHYKYITSRKHEWGHAEVRQIYASTHPAEQHPDVAQLVEALESVLNGGPLDTEFWNLCEQFTASHRGQGGGA